MAGTIDSALNRNSDKEKKIDREAKREQEKAEERRAQDKREGVEPQAPGEMPPHSGTRE
ncbi:MAG: hypothetical protein ABW252_16140 [Polyangiales bacterium]